MKELNLSIYTNRDDESSVTMTAKFESHMDAVAFHEGLAMLCKHHSLQRGKEIVVPENIQRTHGYWDRLSWLAGTR